MTSQAQLRTHRDRYRDSLRREILDAAREAFVRDGYGGVSMRYLAEKVGCSHGNLYLHFKDKETLFDCLVEESFQQFADGLRAVPESTRRGDPVEFLRKAGRAYVAFGIANASAYEFAFILRRPGREHRPGITYERMRSAVQRCIDEKRFRRIDVDTASQALWAAAHGITALLISRPTFPWADREKLIGRVIDAAVDGLLA
ncbi:MAG TPA: TetR/AcrR family transcriptional regulator [Candidatus Polarisedimenticolia bacterium]|nr:TetR/AcrR family transcriptional regulator [Candidatus Polarisedimenticolia bacterium]